MYIVSENIDHIINDCIAHKPQAQKQLYTYCYQQMFAVCMRYTFNRDDAAQLYNTAMLKVFQSIHTYQGKGAFLGWVRRLVVNTCIDHCRKQATYKEVAIDIIEDKNVMVESYWENNISSQQVMAWLQALPKNTALVFNLYALEGYQIQEIAEKLNITVGTAKWHISEARKKLKQNLQHLNFSKNA
jgi:RNA polymerase sigma-70 factor, ECF subfamily